MKKILIIIILILNLSIVSAGLGKTLPLDFTLRDDYVVPMYVGDRVSFNLKNSEHTIILDKIDNEVVELDVFLFLETKHNCKIHNLCIISTTICKLYTIYRGI